MEFVAILIVITTILFGLYCSIVENLLNKLHIYNMIKGFPGPKAHPIIGNVNLLIGNTEDITHQFLNISKNFQSLWRLWLGMKLFVIVDNSEYIKSEEYEFLKPAVRNGLITVPGESFLQNIYSTKHMDVFINHFIALIEKLETLVGEELDV
ncbi:cytochrome P450 4C1-like isoform X1 [Vespula squamosa]|uniref:Cytochrome P450 4C1-like isoform X1 n=1 Tax=Vespula squamosa TaxID=30214 RepID=A0ABD2BH85_VESSQ